MRITTFASLLGAAAFTAVAGCAVHDVDQPELAGPSTFAHSIIMVADRDTLQQNGQDFTDIRITSLSPNGSSENVQLRAQIYVDGVPNDFGTLSTKTPITPTTIRYTSPVPSSLAATQVATTVSIGVYTASAGDARGEVLHTVDIRLLPQGIILPTNPSLVAEFAFAPTAPQLGQTVSFDASASTNGGSACLTQCTYTWDFGDGTSGTGLSTTHQFRTQGNFPVKLTVTDPRGASASKTTLVPVAAPTPPTGTVTVQPNPAPTNVDVFFNASSVQWTGRTITAYDWDFGDGSRGSGVTTTHRYSGVRTYNVVLTVSDGSGAQAQLPAISVAVGSAAANGTADFTFTPASPRVNQQVSFNASASTPSAGATIVAYKYNYGDGTEETSSNPVQSHTYGNAGTVNVSLETTDTNGRVNSVVKTVTITP